MYHQRIVKMAQLNGQSLEVDFGDLVSEMSMIAAWIVERPADLLALLSEAAHEVCCLLNDL